MKKTETISLKERPVDSKERERDNVAVSMVTASQKRLALVLISFVNKGRQTGAEETNLHEKVT